MDDRIIRLRSKLAESGLDCALVTGLANMRYLSGFTSSDATVLITEKSCCLFTDFRYTIQAAEQTQGFEIIELKADELVTSMQDVLMRDGCKNCAYEEDVLTVGLYNKMHAFLVQFKPWSASFASLRVLKSAEEIASLQRAQELADRSFQELLGRIHPGMTEREVVAELNYIGAKLGSEGSSFDSIVGSGPNGAMCHAVPSLRKLQNGDFVVIDFGCIVDGYHSDMTRTIAVGAVNDVCLRIYDIVLEAHERALQAVRPGIIGKELDAIARDYIKANGYGDCFGHGLGHGFGLEIHEAPRASMRSETVFEPGMTITIEPGIYVEGLCGVRIEDCCVVTENGYRNFVSSPKELLVIS